MKSVSKYKLLESKTHNSFTNTIIRRYIFQNLDFHKVDDIIKEYVITHNKKYEEYETHCLSKLLTTKSRVKYIRIKPQLSLHYSFYFTEK